jgi:hypothetical protein
MCCKGLNQNPAPHSGLNRKTVNPATGLFKNASSAPELSHHGNSAAIEAAEKRAAPGAQFLIHSFLAVD